MLDAGTAFGRYLDVDGDGIPYRTYPGTHPKSGAYFTRGTTKDRMAKYSEAGPDYIENMERLLKKFETAKSILPAPVRHANKVATRIGVMYYGSTSPAMEEAFELLQEDGIVVDGLRIRAFPFHEDVEKFVAAHDMVFLVEQNRDAQLRTLLMTECEMDPAKLTPVLHYDGTPITARFIAGAIGAKLGAKNAQAQRSAAGN
jgi:2-oxoglutarate ferredoxin oxidoreductase subunit alpha